MKLDGMRHGLQIFMLVCEMGNMPKNIWIYFLDIAHIKFAGAASSAG